jgi:hypothetical protein
MTEANVSEELITREIDEADPGASIGQRPEREAESIPGAPKRGDERVAGHDAAPGVPGEPDTDQDKTEFDRHREAGQAQ